MGISQSWLAVRGKDKSDIWEGLHVRGTGKSWVSEQIGGREIAEGWYLIVADRAGHRLVGEESAERLSKNAEVVISAVHEGCMLSNASYWRDGKMIWSVEHDPELGFDHLAIKGQPSEQLRKVQDYLEEHSECFPFEVPLEWARLVSGYRYDGLETYPRPDKKQAWVRKGYDDDKLEEQYLLFEGLE